jgi:hypothetical protein
VTERPRITARLARGEAVCPLCRTDLLEAALPSEACAACGVRYHQDCARELGGCSTAGCARQGEPPAADAQAERDRRRARIAAEHEEALRRFRAQRDQDRRARRLDDVGLGFQLAALAGAAVALWELWRTTRGDVEHAALALGGLLLAAVVHGLGRALSRR